MARRTRHGDRILTEEAPWMGVWTLGCEGCGLIHGPITGAADCSHTPILEISGEHASRCPGDTTQLALFATEETR